MVEQFTPGPWMASSHPNAIEWDVRAPDGEDDPWCIALVFGGFDNDATTEANALLIAAAPAMYAALVHARARLVTLLLALDEKAAFDQIDHAIKLATGAP